MHEIVAQCIENKWNDACAMLMEHDEFMKNKPKSSIWKYYSLTWKLYFAQRDYQQVCQEYDAKYILVNNASENYYNVRQKLSVLMYFFLFLILFLFSFLSFFVCFVC
jgi:hypothetical protein